MGFHFSIRIFQFHRKPPFQNLLLKTPLILFSTFSAERNTFPHIFQQCSKRKAHEPGRQAHARMVVSGFKPTVFDATCLLQMYIKCSRLESAAKVFDRMSERNCVSWTAMIYGYSINGKMGLAQSLFDLMPERNVVSWTSLISGYLHNGNYLKSLELFVMMGRDDVAYNATTFSVVLKACAILKDCVVGRQAHARMIVSAFKPTVFASNCLLQMYIKCSRLEYAVKVFDRMSERDCVSWTTMISGYSVNGKMGLALSLFDLMPERNVVSWTCLISGYLQNGSCLKSVGVFVMMGRDAVAYDAKTFSVVLKACTQVGDVGLGKQIHAQIIKQELQSNAYIISTLVDMYSKCGNMQDSILMFQKSSKRNVVTWTSMVCAYARHGNGNEALQVFEEMLLEKVMPNHLTFTGVLRACAHNGLVDEAFHYLYVMKSRYGLEPELEQYTCVVDALGRCGRIIDALKFIEDMPFKANVVIWTSLLSNCKMHGNVKVAEIAATSLLQLNPQDYTAYALLSQIYADAGMWDEVTKMGRIMRRRRLKKQPGCSWIEVQDEVHMFAAQTPFYRNTFPHIFQECSKRKAHEPGRQAHARMIVSAFKPTVFASNCLLQMYIKCSRLEYAVKVFDRMSERDCVSWTTMISGYSVNGKMGLALSLFDLMPERDVVSWNSLISGYLQNENCLKSVGVFVMMGRDAVAYDAKTFLVVLKACTQVGDVGLGKRIHAQIIKQQLQSNVRIISTLVDMYSKCGNMQDSILMFQKSSKRNVVSWASMVCAYARHGNGNEALQVFEEMLLEKVMPNHATFTGVLRACADIGLVDEALHYLYVMKSKYGLEPELEQYACVVDALGRCGRIIDALKFIEDMPFKADDVIWISLLSNCKMQGNVKLAKIAATSLLQLDPQSSSAYVLLSQIYADAGMWNEASKMRRMMTNSGIKKRPGRSWIEVSSL